VFILQEYHRVGIVDAVRIKKDGMSLKQTLTNSGELSAQAASEFAMKHLVNY
jgi:hypothetical protein